MNHKQISLIKSIFRIFGLIFLINNKLLIAGTTLIIAEFLGILEEEYETKT
jgi:hypothetical protein